MRRKLQDKMICIRVSTTFKKGLEEAALKAGEPSVAEFVKRTMIKEAAKYGVKIRR